LSQVFENFNITDTLADIGKSKKGSALVGDAFN